MSNNKNKSEETNWSEYFDSWVDVQVESKDNQTERLSRKVAQLEKEVESLDAENSRLTQSMQMMEKI